jgi:hypothetical protein
LQDNRGVVRRTFHGARSAVDVDVVEGGQEGVTAEEEIDA